MYQCYGMVDEHTSEIVRKYKDLRVWDYRLLAQPQWDSYNMKDLNGTYSGNVIDSTVKGDNRDDKAATATTSGGAKKKRKSGGSWFSSSSQ